MLSELVANKFPLVEEYIIADSISTRNEIKRKIFLASEKLFKGEISLKEFILYDYELFRTTTNEIDYELDLEYKKAVMGREDFSVLALVIKLNEIKQQQLKNKK